MKDNIKKILNEYNFNNEREAEIRFKEKVVFHINKNEFNNAQVFNDKLLILNSNNYEANRDKAFIKYNLNDLEIAENSIIKALKINDQDVFGLNIYALILISKKQYTKSIIFLKKAISIDRNYIDTYNNLGTCFFENERLDDAFKYFSKAYKINKNYPNTLINIGNILSLKDKYTFAIRIFNKALEILPNNINVLSNIAICYFRKRDIKKAKEYFEKVENISQNNHDLKYIYSTTLLNLGEYKKAWKLFESRFYLKKNYKFIKNQKIKSLDKEINFKNDKILILREQGIGEEILFSSIYRRILINDNISIETDERLLDVFTRSFNKKVFYKEGYFSDKNELLKEFDHIIHAGSLCKYFINSEKDIDTSAYLIEDANIRNLYKKKSFFQDKEKLKVGISWRSKVSIYGDLKSISIKDFDPIYKKNRSIFSLQYGNIETEKILCKKTKRNLIFFDNVDLFNDFNSLMGILANIDIFITVSNSTAHLAAAMGVRTILLCPKKSSTYFYWDIKRKKSPWYKNVIVLSIEGSIKKTMQKINEII